MVFSVDLEEHIARLKETQRWLVATEPHFIMPRVSLLGRGFKARALLQRLVNCLENEFQAQLARKL